MTALAVVALIVATVVVVAWLVSRGDQEWLDEQVAFDRMLRALAEGGAPATPAMEMTSDEEDEE